MVGSVIWFDPAGPEPGRFIATDRLTDGVIWVIDRGQTSVMVIDPTEQVTEANNLIECQVDDETD